MPIVSRFFGIIIRMFYDEHNPPHIHVEYQNKSAVFDFHGNITRGNLESQTATRLTREWIDLHLLELKNNWRLIENGKEMKKIKPLI